MDNAVNMNIRVTTQLKAALQQLADDNLVGNLSQLVNLICQDFVNNGRSVTVGSKKKGK